MLISGVAYMTPTVDVGTGRDAFNSITGTDILYNFTGADYLNGNLDIFDQNGTLARSIDTGVHANGNYSLHWSGDYGNGTSMPDGSYAINATLALDHYMMTRKTGNALPMIPEMMLPLIMGVNASGYTFVSSLSVQGVSLGDRIYVYRPDGSFFSSFNIGPGNLPLITTSIAFNSSGFIFIANSFSYSSTNYYNVSIFNPDYSYFGQIDRSKTGTPQLSKPAGIAFNSSNFAYVTDADNRVFVFSPGGTFLYSWGSAGSGPGQFNFPQSGHRSARPGIHRRYHERSRAKVRRERKFLQAMGWPVQAIKHRDRQRLRDIRTE